jgi:hypothetical protein
MIYMAVTADKYELPIAIADTRYQLAIMLGLNKSTVYRALREKLDGHRCGMKFVQVEEEEDER